MSPQHSASSRAITPSQSPPVSLDFSPVSPSHMALAIRWCHRQVPRHGRRATRYSFTASPFPCVSSLPRHHGFRTQPRDIGLFPFDFPRHNLRGTVNPALRAIVLSPAHPSPSIRSCFAKCDIITLPCMPLTLSNIRQVIPFTALRYHFPFGCCLVKGA
jgi:hypothetical protein